MSKHHNIVSKITNWKVIFGIQVFISLLLIAFLVKLGALPLKYTLIVIGVVLGLDLISLLLMKSNHQSKKTIFGKILSLLVSFSLLMGSFLLVKGDMALSHISGVHEQTTRISLLVKEESSYQSLSDLTNQTIETSFQQDEVKMKQAISALKKAESSIKVDTQDQLESLVDDLYDGRTPAIFVNQAYYPLFSTKHENFQKETREIWFYEIEEEMENISKQVNVSEDTFTVFISGIDTTGKVSTVSRSDVNMLVSVNPKTKQLLMTSIPRDYYVTLANKNKKDKLTHAGIFGVENSVKTLENFMNIDINYYAKVNFTSLMKIVDIVGGIDVYSDRTLYPNAGKGITIHKGMNHMDGKMALSFARERHAYASGDNHRVQNQQEVLKALINKLMSPSILTHATSLLHSVSDSLETNMSSSEMTSLIQMQLDDMAKWDIQQTQLTGKGAMMKGGAMMPKHKLYYMIPNQESVNQATALIKKMINNERITVKK